MNFAKCLLVALALWMPAASFAAALNAGPRTEASSPCEEERAPEGVSERAEDSDAFLPIFVVPALTLDSHTVLHESHRPLDGHIAELHSPPPNRA